MPVYERSYRRWDGALHTGGGRLVTDRRGRSSTRAPRAVRRCSAASSSTSSLLGSLCRLWCCLLNYGYHFPPMDFMSEEALGLLDQLAVYRVVQYSVLMVYSAPLLLLWAVCSDRRRSPRTARHCHCRCTCPGR